MTFEPVTTVTLLAILPEILLVVLASLVMGLDLLFPALRKRGLGLTTAWGFGLILIVALIFSRPGGANALIFGGMLRNDFIAFTFRALFLFAGMIVALISLDVEGVGTKGEYYAILVGAVIGMDFMAASADLIMLYLAIETTSI